LHGCDAGFLSEEPTRYHALCRPDKLACVELSTGTRLTYGELDARIESCAAQLRKLPDGAVGERVAFVGRNGIDLVVLSMACHRAGAVFVPLNWRLTGAELKVLVAGCTPRLLIYDAEFARAALEAADGAAGPTVSERTLAAVFDRGTTAATPPARIDPTAPCTLLYTSGTTGRPKAAIITRAGAFFSSLNFIFVGELGPDCTLLSDAPMFHTVGLFATVRTALTVGATLVISDRFAPEVTLRAMSDPALDITHYFGVPQIALALRNDPGYASADLSRLRAIFVGGAPPSRTLIEDFLADGVKLVNGYGLSEVGTVMHMPLDAAALAARPGSVGFPGPLVETRIVRLDGAEAEADEVGELWLRGPSVTPGYWKDPQATAAAFQDGWYRTGDLARRDAGGFHWLVDRLKDMYISGGENVYPAEVENVLWELAGVADVAVLGVPHEVWGETGVAFIVARDGATLSETDVRAFCNDRLARYKHPTEVRFVEAIPRTASGKIQRHLLRDLHRHGDSGGGRA
jgi:fatty-acyl-CoA synthase